MNRKFDLNVVPDNGGWYVRFAYHNEKQIGPFASERDAAMAARAVIELHRRGILLLRSPKKPA